MLKFYAGSTAYTTEQANTLTPLLRAEIEYSAEERCAAGLPVRVSSPSEADFVAIPRVWSDYAVVRRNLDEPLAMAAQAAAAGKTILVWHTGDLSPIMPFGNCVVMVNALQRSTRPRNWHVAPRFIDDPLRTYGLADGRLVLRDTEERPRVGFCGFAATHPIKLTYSVLENLKFRVANALGIAVYEPPPIVPATLLRAKVLATLKCSPRLETNFIIRTRYKAGAYNAGKHHPAVRDFYDNILNTDYTVCVRGYGNWSVRLYETLACGRIPILVDTDCGLPFDQIIDWKEYCVWVPAGDVARASEYVADFHSRLSPTQFRGLQQACRELWERRLTLKGFLSHFHEHFGWAAALRCVS